MRSEEAIAAWKRLNLSEMSRIGSKKRSAYWSAATRIPSVTACRTTWPPPYQSSSAMAIVPTTWISG